MSYKTLTCLVVLFCISFHSLSLCQTSGKKKKENKPAEILYLSYSPGDYEALWRQIDSLDNLNMTKSAKKIAEDIYQMATGRNNSRQALKALMVKLSYEKKLDSKNTSLIVNELKKEIPRFSFPESNILKAVLGRVYQEYYSENIHKMMNRSQVPDDTSSDFEAWSPERLKDETISLFEASIENAEGLKKIPALEFSDIIYEGNEFGERYRPTLYDMLCHQALDCFMNHYFNLDKFEDRFSDEPGLMGTSEEFIRLTTDPQKNLLIKEPAVRVLRDLTLFHIKDTAKYELADIDLQRLEYFRRTPLFITMDSLYIKALQRMLESYTDRLSRPRILAALANSFYQRSTYLAQFNLYRDDREKALELCNSVIHDYPGSFGSRQAEKTQKEILRKYFSLETESGSLPGEAFRVRVSSANVEKAYFRIISAGSAAPDSIIQDPVKLLKFYLGLRPYKYFNQILTDSGDCQNHKYNVIMPELPIGEYVIVASADSGFSINSYTCFENIFITNLSLILKSEDNNARIYVLDRKTGKPVEGATVDISGKERFSRTEVESRRTILTTDEDGYADLKLLYGSYNIKLSKGNDLLEMDYWEYDKENEINSIKGETYFFLDRVIYRPGQKMFFKGLSLVYDKTTGEHRIWENGELTVTIMDPKGNAIGKLKVTTNEYGTFSAEFDLPVNMLTGRCTIRDGFSEAYFQVEEYKRPQFEVKVDKIKEEYNLNDQVHLTGRIESYSGAGLSGAEVRYHVERIPVCFYGKWRYRQGYPGYRRFPVITGRAAADSKGEFSINFRTIPDSRDKIDDPVYCYYVSLEVTDKAGETHKAETSLLAGYVSLLSDIDIPDVVIKNEKQDFEIITNDLNGNFKPTQVDISLFRLKKPGRVFRQPLLAKADSNLISKEDFYRIFKHDAFSDEDNFVNWQMEKHVSDTSFVTRENIPLSRSFFNRLEQGKYLLKLAAKDKNGNPVEVIRYFTLLDPDAGKIPLQEALWMHPLKLSAEPGENLKVSLGTALDEMNIMFEVEHRGKIVKQEWVSLKNEQKLIEVPIKEKYRGGIILRCYAVWENSFYSFFDAIDIPWSNKKLKVELASFRSKITPGETEQWKLKVLDQNGKPVESEVLAAMYDESLDQLSRPNSWDFNIYAPGHDFSFRIASWNSDFKLTTLHPALWESQDSYYQPSIRYNEFYYYGLFNGYYETYGDKKYKSRTFESSLFKMSPFKDWVRITANKPEIYKDYTGAVTIMAGPEGSGGIRGGRVAEVGYTIENDNKSLMKQLRDFNSQQSIMQIIPRKDLSETAFFFPHLITNSEGIAHINFRAPEALTKWKFMAFAHTGDLEFGMLTSETVTQKKMMVQAFPPRFFRENDTIWYTARVSNLTDSTLSGHVQLMSFDAASMKPVDAFLGNENPLQEVCLEPKETKAFTWKLAIPEGSFRSVLCRVAAQSGSFSDGEESLIPVLENRMLVTESMPLPLKGNENRSFVFESLRSKQSPGLKNFKLTLEFTSNPAYLAFQALPSLMEYSFESADNVFNSYYSSSIAMHIANSNPELKKVLESWKASGKETLLSNLQKNKDLKNILLEETPWYAEAQNETERKARLAELFDYATLRQKLDKAEERLRSMQTQTGGWAWFPGMRENICLTQSIISGFGHLEKLGTSAITPKSPMEDVLLMAVHRCDEKMYTDYLELKKRDSTLTGVYLDNEKVQYLYARSFFTKYPLYVKYEEAFNFWKKHLTEKWQQRGLYMQGMIALMCSRYNDKENAEKIMKSVLDNAVTDNEMGMHFNQMNGYYWYESPIESQALLIEATDEILRDSKSVDEMKVWLLKNKQTHSWKSPRATAEAVYALLLRGTDWTEGSQPAEIQIGGEKLDLVKNNPEAGTGYVKMSWDAEKIRPEMSNVMITNRNSVPSWGALYWQYFEKLDKISEANSGLSIHKELLLKTGNNKAARVTDATQLKAGDELKVRLIIKTDRDMEFVHIKDMRASGLEPINVLSGSRSQDGLYYYEATKDASTNFFIDRLPKGTYVFEYPLKVAYNGTFSDGIAEIQCLYAPEFRSHSGEAHLRVQ